MSHFICGVGPVMKYRGACILARAIGLGRLGSTAVRSQKNFCEQQLSRLLGTPGTLPVSSNSSIKHDIPELNEEIIQHITEIIAEDKIECVDREIFQEEDKPLSKLSLDDLPPEMLTDLMFSTSVLSPSLSTLSSLTAQKNFPINLTSSPTVSCEVSPPIQRDVAVGEETEECYDAPAHLAPILATVERVLSPAGPKMGPMPLHELANKSPKIQKLVQLGMDLSVIIREHRLMERLLEQNFEADIQPRLRFLVDKGVEAGRLGWILTRNPNLLWTDVDDMTVRVNYLEVKQFDQVMISRILNHAPFWLSLSTKDIDSRLGFFQTGFSLTGEEVRLVAVEFPKLVSATRWETVKLATQLMEKSCGFNESQRKELLLKAGMCYYRPRTVQNAVHYFNHTVGLSHAQLVKHNKLLYYRLNRTKPRHEFLKFLKRDQYDASQPGYVSPDSLWQGSDEYFCELVAKTSIEDYNTFLQSI